MPLMTGPYATEQVGDHCAWVAAFEPSDFPFTYCGAPSVYVMISKVNGSSFYACEEHMAVERLCNPKSIAQIRTYRSAEQE